MKFNFLIKLVLVLSAIQLLSCSNHPYKNRSTDYVNAELKTYDLSGIELEEDAMPIPAGEIAPFSGKESNFKVPRPQPLALGVKNEDIQVRDLNSRKWIWANWQTSQIWVDLYDFIDAEKISVLRVDAKRGSIFTKTPSGDLELAIRQGVVRNTSELYLNPKSEFETGLTDKYREKLVAFLKNKRGTAVSLVGLNLEKKQDVELFLQDSPYLILDFSLDRTILEMNSVLTNSFNQETKKLQDKNFSKREFYIKYVSPLQDLEKSQESDFLYTLKLSAKADKTKVEILTRQLKPVQKPIAEEILRFIQRQFQ